MEHSHEVSEEEVKRHLLRLRPPTVGGLFGRIRGAMAGARGAIAGAAAINYTEVYESFTDQYCSDPEGERPDPPSFSLDDPLYAKTVFTGPTLGIQIAMGSCTDIGNKTFECLRPQIVVVKSPATIKKAGPELTFEKPGGVFVDKTCDWRENRQIGHGESAELYNGGKDTYDYSGYRAALYGRTGARFGRIASVYNGIRERTKGRLAPLSQLIKRRGLSEFDINKQDLPTRKRIEEVLPGFFDD